VPGAGLGVGDTEVNKVKESWEGSTEVTASRVEVLGRDTPDKEEQQGVGE
jgi:hypothetical protein